MIGPVLILLADLSPFLVIQPCNIMTCLQLSCLISARGAKNVREVFWDKAKACEPLHCHCTEWTKRLRGCKIH